MKNAKANDNVIQNGDFELVPNTQWMYSLTGSPIEVSDEVVVIQNRYVEIKTTQSFFQRTSFKPNDSGTVTFSVRGELPVTVSIMDATLSNEPAAWSEEVPVQDNEGWTVITLPYALGDDLTADMCLHFQANWDQNTDATVDIDNVILDSEAGSTITHGDFESGWASWTDSLSGSAIQTSTEEVEGTNHFARIHSTASIFQHYSFKSNQSGVVKVWLRGDLGITVAIIDVSDPQAIPLWSQTIMGNSTDFFEFPLDFNIGEVGEDDQGLALHLQADNNQNLDEYVDIDNVSMIIN
jgi:hypothetical protein